MGFSVEMSLTALALSSQTYPPKIVAFVTEAQHLHQPSKNIFPLKTVPHTSSAQQ